MGQPRKVDRPIVKIGFTGTQQGMTVRQTNTVNRLLRQRYDQHAQFHHGDCIGADAEAHDLAKNIGFKIHIHPPVYGSKRARRTADVIYSTRSYLKRNKHIVTHTDRLIAAPKEMEEVLRSGTWSTIRYARILDRPVMVSFTQRYTRRIGEKN